MVELRQLSTTRSFIVHSRKRTTLALRNDDLSIQMKHDVVSDGAGFTLSPGEKVVFNKQGGSNPERGVWVWAESGTPNIEILEEYAEGFG